MAGLTDLVRTAGSQPAAIDVAASRGIFPGDAIQRLGDSAFCDCSTQGET